MALIPVAQDVQNKNKKKGLINYVAPVAGIVGGAATIAGSVGTMNPVGLAGGGAMVAGGLAGLNEASRMDKYKTQNQSINMDSAMARRSQAYQNDPMQTLQQARDAIAYSNLDEQTRQQLEIPILKAMQTQSQSRGMA